MLHFLSTWPIRAVLLDVDGTLYYQQRLRALMALELGLLPVEQKSCKAAYHTWRAIGIFRRAREELRRLEAGDRCLDVLQYSTAAQQAGWETEAMERLVAEWLYQRPLKYLRFCRRRGLHTFFTFLRERNIQVGVFSDYPVIDKLRSLGCAEGVSIALCATQPEINAFKPSPTGFLRACTLWGVRPEEVLYVGDRPEVDALGAANAGMPCAILARQRCRRTHEHVPGPYRTFSSFKHLQRALGDYGDADHMS